MNLINKFVLGGVLLLTSSVLGAQTNIGGFNVYYGSLHNHCNISDGVNTPDAAYNYAKNTGKLDFFSLSDHSGAIDATEWSAMKTAADAYNAPGVFTSFWGFEWTENVLGHVAVINPTNYITTAAPYNTFAGLCTWLNSNECVAFFNHPGRNNSTGLEFNHFAGTPTNKIAGIELWNKTDRFNTYYYTDGYYSGDGNKSWYDEALARGWQIGAGGGEDNHSGTWGTMTPSKLAVLSSANTRTDIMNALKAKRFYSTYDLNLALSFKINANEMGSTVTGGNYTLQIQASDGSSDVFTQVELLKNGTVINTWTPNSTSVNITMPIYCVNGEYYYVRVKQGDADEAISSPIWVTGGTDNLSPVVTITAPANNEVLYAPATLLITANATDNDGNVAKVEFYQGSSLLGEDLTAPYSFNWEGLASGTYVIKAKATDNLGSMTLSEAVTVSVYNPGTPDTNSAVIATGTDDVEESAAGAVYTNSTDIELVYDSYNSAGNQFVGLRFINLNIPPGATIDNAYIQFACDEVSSASCALVLKGEAADNSAAFAATTKNVSGRTLTATSVNWSPAAWPTVDVSGTDQRTPDLKTIVQEITSRPGFTLSSPITIIITGTGSRIAEAYEGVPASAAKLYVTFTVSPLITPEFEPIGPVCQNSVPVGLPATSSNGIAGSWSPESITTSSAGTAVYTFTPDPGQGAIAATLSVTVTASVVPTFAVIGPLYQYSTASPLPASSTNGIEGTWTPSVINTANLGTTTYFFTPSDGQCATSATANITIIPRLAPAVALTLPVNGTTYIAPASVILNATATDADGTITRVDFYNGTTLLGSDNTNPYSCTWNSVPAGTYTLTAVASDNDGLVTTSAAVSVTVNAAPVSFSLTTLISAGIDDVEQYASGTMLINSPDIQLVYDTKSTGNQNVGLRFNRITIPAGVTITNAYLQFTSTSAGSGTTKLTIKGQKISNAPVFTTSKNNVSGRTKTSASVSWAPASWLTAGAAGTAQKSPDLKSIVQEIVNLSGWTSGNSMVFIISGTGTRTAGAYEKSAQNAAKLIIEYTTLKRAINAGTAETVQIPETPVGSVLTCYPIPFKDELNISFVSSEDEQIRKIEVYNSSGKLVKTVTSSENFNLLPISGFQPGLYVIKVVTNRKMYIRKAVKI